MSDEGNVIETNVQATGNSTAVGKIEVDGSVGNLNIGGTHIVNYVSSGPAQPPDFDEIIKTQSFEPETLLIPAGPFLLGSDPGDGVKDYETPRHEVELPVYRISKYPVLNHQYQEFILKNSGVKPPVGWSGRKAPEATKNEPVRGVTWEDARKYCEWLKECTGRNYALPNEAQLEKLYQGSYGSSDILEEISLWTSTLWGEYLVPPDPRYRYPWKSDDGRNDLNAHNQMRRVICRYRKGKDTQTWQRFSRTGQFPRKPFPPGAYSFRIVLNF